MFNRLFKENVIKADNKKVSAMLPDDILITIFQLLSVRDLGLIPQLARNWKKVFYHQKFWHKKMEFKNLSDYLCIGLFHSIKKKMKLEIISRYCRLGANTNCYMSTYTPKDYGWLDMRVAFFTKATSLSIAANTTSGAYGEALIKILIQYNANPTLRSTYSVRWVQPLGILTDAQYYEETPAKSARDKKIRSLLLLAEHQFLVKNNASDKDVEDSLIKAMKI